MSYRVYYYYQPKTEMYYIGKTKDPLYKRAINKHTGIGYKKSKKFFPAIQEYGLESFERGILKDNLSREEASYWEQFYIREYDSVNHGYNCQTGGDGCPGITCSEELRKYKSEIGKAKAHYEGCKAVNQYDLAGTLLATYFSIREASKRTGISSGIISLCCNNKIRIARKKYRFQFA